MDLIDRKLLLELDKNSRQPDSLIAKHAKASKQVVGYRIKDLARKGIIKHFEAALNIAALGKTVFGVYFKLQRVDEKREKEIIDFLKRHDKVLYLALLGGKYDLNIVIPARNVFEFNRTLNGIIESYSENLSSFDISARISAMKFQRGYLSAEKSLKGKATIEGESRQAVIDSIDKNLLKELSCNARVSLKELHEKIHVPASTIALRIKKLEEKKVIQAFTALFDPPKYGYELYKTLLTLQKTAPEAKKRLIDFCEMHPNITWVFETLGGWNMEIRSEVENKIDYQKLLIELRNRFPDIIRDLETITIFEELKEDFSVAIG